MTSFFKKRTLTIDDVKELICFESRAGHPDDFVPNDARVRVEIKGKIQLSSDVVIIVEWEDT